MGYIFQCGIFVLSSLRYFGIVNSSLIYPIMFTRSVRLDPKSFSFFLSFSTMRLYKVAKSDIFKRNDILLLLAEVAVKKSEFYFEV